LVQLFSHYSFVFECCPAGRSGQGFGSTSLFDPETGGAIQRGFGWESSPLAVAFSAIPHRLFAPSLKYGNFEVKMTSIVTLRMFSRCFGSWLLQ
jgi:hypothetical protein